MLTMTDSACIDAPVEAVWAVLSELEAIQLWVQAIRRSRCPAQKRGVGALRVCELGQAIIHETIVEWMKAARSLLRAGVRPLPRNAQGASHGSAGGQHAIQSQYPPLQY